MYRVWRWVWGWVRSLGRVPRPRPSPHTKPKAGRRLSPRQYVMCGQCLTLVLRGTPHACPAPPVVAPARAEPESAATLTEDDREYLARLSGNPGWRAEGGAS